jgi:molybdopterin converting factor small subunit
MPVTVSIPTPLRGFTAGQERIELDGDTVGQVLDRLLAEHAGLQRHLLQDDGRLRSFVNLYLNETDIRHLASTATPVRSGDVLNPSSLTRRCFATHDTSCFPRSEWPASASSRPPGS